MYEAILNSLHQIDRELAHYLKKQGASDLVALGGALASFALSRGDSCLHPMTTSAEQLWPEAEERPALPSDRGEWVEELRSSPLVSDGAPALLVLREERLYLGRYWHYERQVLEAIRPRLTARTLPQFSPETEALMSALFATTTDFSDYQGDLQLAGSLLPLLFPFAVISGGPGTGKTTTVTKLLAVLLSHNPALTIALAAPTGKAAQRMNESITDGLNKLPIPAAIADKISALSASTIHRLLGVRHLSPHFRHNAEEPLECDLLVVDEASMIDLPLLAKLLSALKAEAQIILLGDQFQLASVEAGAVLGDLCHAFANNSFDAAFVALHSRYATAQNHLTLGAQTSPIIQLKRSFRFNSKGGIGLVSSRINEADSSIAATLKPDSGAIQLRGRLSPSELAALSAPLRSASSVQEALSALNSGMILTIKNDGTYGQEQVNEQLLRHFGAQPYIQNMPLMITENSYELGLFNGDMGIVRQRDSQWYAYFPGDEEPRELPIVLLPSWQTAFAITIHKSQGSEYGKLIVLLGESETPLLTREILYTAITRAKPTSSEEGAVILQGTEAVVKAAIEATVERVSGLSAEL